MKRAQHLVDQVTFRIYVNIVFPICDSTPYEKGSAFIRSGNITIYVNIVFRICDSTPYEKGSAFSRSGNIQNIIM